MKTLAELFRTPRMDFADICDNNSVEGLHDMIKEVVKPNFTIVEIGSYAGVSSDLFARFCDRLYCIDVWDMGSPGLTTEWLTAAYERFKIVALTHTNIAPIKEPSLRAVRGFADHSIDLVYIDAVHDYEDVKADITAWLPKVKSGGYISGHDFHMGSVQQAVKETIGTVKTYKDTSWLKKLI